MTPQHIDESKKLLDFYREAEDTLWIVSERKAALREIDLRLIADSTRLIQQSWELLLRIE